MNRLMHNEIRSRRAIAIHPRRIPLGLVLLLALGLLVVASMLVSPPIALSAERYTISGSAVSIYNLAGELTVEAYKGSDVVVEVTRGGHDAGELRVESNARGGREALRIIYPDRHIIYPRVGSGSHTDLRVRSDGTFGDGLKDLFGMGERVSISGSGRGLEAHADLRVLVPAGKNVAFYLGAGAVNASDVAADMRLNTNMGSVECNSIRGTVKIDTGSGSVRARVMRGDLDIETGSGDVVTADVEGEKLHVDTGSGSVATNGIKATMYNVQTGSGDVLAEHVDASDIRVDTGSGRVSVGLSSNPDKIKIDTGSGEVLVRVPADFHAEFNLDTGSGGIDLDMPHSVTKRDSGHLSGRIGDGGGLLYVDTGSGGIQVTRASKSASARRGD